jgi:hypothetical protein
VGFTQLILAVVEISFEKAIPIHTMSEYNLDLQYNDDTYGENEVNFKNLNLVPIVISPNAILSQYFIDCQFNSCNFTSSNINHVP